MKWKANLKKKGNLKRIYVKKLSVLGRFLETSLIFRKRSILLKLCFLMENGFN